MIKEVIKELQDVGRLSDDQIVQAQAQAQQASMTLEQYLLDQNLITQQQIAQVYAKVMQMSYLETIGEKMADSELLSKVQFNFLRQHLIMPLMIDGSVAIAVANPFKLSIIDEIKLLVGLQAPVYVASGTVIIDAINKYYPLEGAKQMIDELEEEQGAIDQDLDISAFDDQDILTMASQAPIVKLVNHILFQAVKRGASDIHIEPFEKEVRVRYRVDGVMFLAFTPPKRVQGALGSRIKIMANLNIAEKRKPQDGRIEIKVAEKPIDIRVSVLPVAHGERVVMRLLDKSKTALGIEKLGLSKRDYEVMVNTIMQPNGIILVSGPTGSGKTTTLYSILGRLNQPDVNIITVEDPVEYQIQGLNQVQVNDKIELTFAAALRSILRQDPDVVMIGETRDAQTAQIAIQASLTGHLVLSTIHTNNAPATITRLIDMGVEPFLISSSVIAVIAQRLVRVLCQACKQVYTPDETVIKALGVSQESIQGITFYKAVGCDQCSQVGYKGRMPIFEIMQMTGALAHLITQKVDAHVLLQQALKDGMIMLVYDGLDKIKQGLTTVDEVLAVATAQE
ncbi:type II secretion system protein GspE [bacterium]|nr:type II secretion system protein GspE [bacterium]